MRQEEVIKKLEQLCGLAVECADIPQNMPLSGICEDKKTSRTVFTATVGGVMCAFSIAGVGEDKRITAALARELVQSFASKRSDSPIREFLNGIGEKPTVRVGKADYYVFAVYSDSRRNSVREYLSAMATADDFVADMTDNITAFCKMADKSDDYQSAGEFAVILYENLIEEIEDSVKIGVGGVAHGVSELPQYYAYARSSLISGAELDPKNDIYSYKEYALIKVLSELPRTTIEEYINTVLDKNYKAVLSDAELMAAADAFIKHSLNIAEASRSMYVHRNTLIYRLDKIEKMTGLNIRNFNDAMSFRVAYLLYKALK